MKNMPAKPLVFQSGTMSAGLELVDIYLWIFKRYMERKELTKPLSRLVYAILKQRELTVFLAVSCKEVLGFLKNFLNQPQK